MLPAGLHLVAVTIALHFCSVNFKVAFRVFHKGIVHNNGIIQPHCVFGALIHIKVQGEQIAAIVKVI